MKSSRDRMNWKRLMCAALVLSSAIAAYGSEMDRTTVIGMLNGRAVQDLLVEKVRKGDEDASAMRYFEMLTWSAGERVFMRGYVADVSKRLFLNAQKVIVTVGSASGQPVNVKFHMRKDMTNQVKDLRPGQDIAVNGIVSSMPDFQSDLVLDDAYVVPVGEYERLLAVAKANEDSVLGDCLVSPVPFSTLPSGDRTDLAAMAKCAATAYPDRDLPSGYRPMSREEWRRSTEKLGYADAVYSDDGYFIFGNGLRGRFMVHRIMNRAVVAWSGCDLLDGGIRRASGPDFMTCVKHALLGETSVQFNQAADITAGVLNAFNGEVWVVGHSLGGSLVTYAALRIEDASGRLKCATFNALGLSPTVAKTIPPSLRDAGARRIRNVYGTDDPLYGGHQLLSWTKLLPRRFGHAYYVVTSPAPTPQPGKDDAKEDIPGQLRRIHGIDQLAAQLEDEAPAVSGFAMSLWGIATAIVAGVAVVVVIFVRTR